MSGWQHVDVCSHLSGQLTNNFLSKIITGDKTWCFQYDPKSKKTKFAMKTANILTTQDSLHVKITNEDNSSIPRVLFTLNSFHKAKRSSKLIM